MSIKSLTTRHRTKLALFGGLAVVATIAFSLFDAGSDSVKADRTNTENDAAVLADPDSGMDGSAQAKASNADRHDGKETTGSDETTDPDDEPNSDNGDGSNAAGGSNSETGSNAETESNDGGDTTSSPTPPTAQAKDGASKVSAELGFSPGGWFPDEPDARLRDDLDRMVDVGARWLRIDFDWSEIERTRGEYHWHRTDRVIAEANRRDLQVLALLGNSPGWSRTGGSSKSPPDDSADFAKFAADSVDRYAGQGVAAWELWNEPNLAQFWAPRPDPNRYAELAITTMAEMRAIDPSVTIIAGGLAPAADTDDGSELSPETFLVQTLDAGASSFDAFAIHPYSYPALPIDPASAGWNPFHNLPRFHEILASRGHGGKQIWLTEYGAPTGTAERSVTETHQSRSITEAIAAVEEWAWAGPLLLYAHRDQRSAPSDLESNFGLLTTDGHPKQAWRDLVALTAD